MSTKLADMEDFADCTIIVDSIKFGCHKVILSRSSDFFRSMFLSNYQESISEEVNLQGVTPVIFTVFRDYVYTLNSEVLNNYDSQTLISLFKCGDMWLVPALVKDCATELVYRANNMDVADQAALFELGHKYNNQVLIDGITSLLKGKDYPFQGDNVTFLFNEDIFKKMMTLFNDQDNKDQITKDYLEFNRCIMKSPDSKNNSSC